jgi:hypothetical protein
MYRRYVRVTVMLTAIALILLSLNANALMQTNADPAARKRSTIPINLAPVPAPNVPLNQLIVDGGFEAGFPNPGWPVQTSTNFGTPICDVPSCTTGGGASPPRTGAFWAWFGGIAAPAENSTLGQTVTMPGGQTVANLSFFMRIGTVTSPFTDVLNVRVDGTLVASYPEPTVAEGAYSGKVINLNTFADGAAHSILFEYIHPAAGGTGSYVVDDVELNTRTPTATDGSVAGHISDANGAPIAGAVVNLSGTQNRKFITDANGDYRFDNVETNGFYNLRPSQPNYSFSPAERSFSLLGLNTEAAFTGSPAARGNPLDTPEYFVRQHYLDFLNREPDESGFNFWSDQILSCGTDAACAERRAINVSAAYFLSTEFQETGGLVDKLYRASYGRRPTYVEFMPDSATVGRGVVVGRADWARQLEENKQAFVAAWVQRAEFQTAYGGMSNAGYVDALISHTGVDFSQSERNALVDALNASSVTRADALRQIAEDGRFVAAKRNEMFVMMQYFGYLRREPDASGYAFWLNKLNQFGGNFEQAEMVKAFIVSGEYRARFAQ